MLGRTCLAIPLALVALGPRPGELDEERRDRAYEGLVERLEDHAVWCKRERLFLQQRETMELLLVADPDHARARRELGWRRKGGEWVAPRKPPRTPEDRAEEMLGEEAERLAAAVRPFAEEMLALLAEADPTPEERRVVEEEILRFDPANATLRAARGEVEAGDAWVLRETVAAARRRAELEAWIAEAREAAGPRAADLADDERALGIPLHAVESENARVLASSGAAEAEELARTLAAARVVFARAFGVEPALPEGFRVFLLQGPDERDRFLAGHPAVTREARERLASLAGSSLEGTSDWAYWLEEPDRRADGIVRLAVGYLFAGAPGPTFETTWAFEGFGYYLTHALLGTRHTSFVPLADAADPATADLRAELARPGASWMALARDVLGGDGAPELAGVLARGPAGISSRELLVAHALAGYLVEGRPDEAPRILLAIGEGRPSAEVLPEVLGADLATLAERLHRWLVEREGAPVVVTASHGEDEARRAWDAMEAEEKEEVVAAFRARLATLGLEQDERVRGLVAGVDRADLPEAGPPPTFDAKVHAPTQPTRRRWLDEDDARVEAVRERTRVEPGPESVPAACRYDWGRGEVVRVGATDGEAELDRVFRSALRGYVPDADLALARLEAELDGGDARAALFAFGHAYTDRDGNAYPGVTLYEAWDSDMLMEMPDVDVLGVVHTVLDDWDTWKEPLSDADHDVVYPRIEELFLGAKRYRELREAVAACGLFGDPAVPDGYGASATNWHAFWAHHGNDAAAVAAALPEVGAWRRFFDAWIDRCQADAAVYGPGVERRERLAEEALAIRTAFIAAMEESGVL